MQVVPVIDVKNGTVVHAEGGDRRNYRPLISSLADGSSPIRVVEGLLSVQRFSILYVADLDAIAGQASNAQAVAEISRYFPDLELWIDNGSHDETGVAKLLSYPAARAVIGSETLQSVRDLEQISAHHPGRVMLSMDFRGDELLGPQDLLQQPQSWPSTVIAMTLAAVGSRAGPDLDRIGRLKSLAPQAAIAAAGGIRDKADLVAAAAAGASAALVATALHAGTLKAGDLQEIAGLPVGSSSS